MIFNLNNITKSISLAVESLYHNSINIPKAKTEESQLVEDLEIALSELKRAEALFNEVTEETAIDYATYNVLAARTKYSHLMNLAKQKNIRF